MIKTSAENILKKFNLSVTDTRKKILRLFVNADGALAHQDIEKANDTQLDRVTIYRTLQTFLDKGIIHSIPSADNAVKYALCKEECSSGHHHHNHVHFLCDKCGTTFCMDEVQIPEIQLPKGFKASQKDVVISGVCDKC